MGLEELNPAAQLMVRQMLFLDPPQHNRIRGLAAIAFTPKRVEQLRSRIEQITNELVDRIEGKGEVEVMEDLANPLPAIVTAGLLGVPASNHDRLKVWSQDFAEVLGNFQHNPDRAARVLSSLEQMTSFFREAVRRESTEPTEGLVNALTNAEVDGDRLTEDEVIANLIITMVGGQETTTNLIGNGLLTLLRNPGEMERLRAEPSLTASAVEELLRYESPSQHTARLAPDDVVMGAANRDPERFSDPDCLNLARPDNRHLAFGWASHFCFGAPLARIEGQIALSALLRRLPGLRLKAGPITWRPNLGLRGLTALPVVF